MACDSDRLGGWIRVPNDSKFVLCVEPVEGGTDECFDASAIFDANDPAATADKEWDHEDLTSCTIREPLSVPLRYVVSVTIAFQGADPCAAVVKAHIELPNGQIRKSKYCRVVTSADGGVERCHLSIITLPS